MKSLTELARDYYRNRGSISKACSQMAILQRMDDCKADAAEDYATIVVSSERGEGYDRKAEIGFEEIFNDLHDYSTLPAAVEARMDWVKETELEQVKNERIDAENLAARDAAYWRKVVGSIIEVKNSPTIPAGFYKVHAAPFTTRREAKKAAEAMGDAGYRAYKMAENQYVVIYVY